MNNKMYNYLTKPFKAEFPFFFLIFILMCSTDIYIWIDRNFFYYSLYILAHDLLFIYMMTLPVGLFKGKFTTIYKLTLLVFACILFIFNCYCNFVICSQNYADIIAIIGATNINESAEYFKSSVPVSFLLVIIILILFLICAFVLIKRITFIFGTKSKLTGITILIISLFLVIHNPLAYKEALLGELLSFGKIEITPDLKKYYSNPELNSFSHNKPDNIVMIIGESFTKSHSSLYNYNKETNPLLSELKEKGFLFTFDSIRSSATHTIESFKTIMSTYKYGYQDSCNWYECVTLPEIIKLSGYKTSWISNQSKTGLFDNVVGRYSELCDTSVFVGDKYSGIRRQNLDGEIFNLLYPILQDTISRKNFYVIHLMGSHVAFDKRYPSDFNRFKSNQYLDYPENQRSILAQYDNAILYNDSVVYELMNLYQNKEAVVFYFPDHGIDLFETSESYFGHARKTDPLSVKVATDIPFMIYTSPKYQENFKDKMNLIKKNFHRKYNTENILYTIMDIVGVKFKDNNDVQNNSLLSD